MDRESELELVKHLKTGDAAAFECVYDEFNGRLFTFLARLIATRPGKVYCDRAGVPAR
jgi:hypothetical protein